MKLCALLSLMVILATKLVGQTLSFSGDKICLSIDIAFEDTINLATIRVENCADGSIFIPLEQWHNNGTNFVFFKIGADQIYSDPLLTPTVQYDYLRLRSGQSTDFQYIVRGSEIRGVVAVFSYFTEKFLRESGYVGERDRDTVKIDMETFYKWKANGKGAQSFYLNSLK